MCANLQPDRKQGEGQPYRAAGWRRIGSIMAVGFRPAISLTNGFHPLPQRNGGELPQTCKRDGGWGDNVSIKCNNAQLTHPGLCFFSTTRPKN